MKRFAVVAMIMALATAPAYAQGMKLTNPKQHHEGAQKKPDDATKVNEKDYKSALDRIPNQGEADPWANVREKPKGK
jgi:hypothetical protein